MRPETERPSLRVPRWAAGTLLVAAVAGAWLVLDRARQDPAPPTAAPAFAPSLPTAPPVDVAAFDPPGEVGVVLTGRLVDAVSGLPVQDAGVAVLGLDRRTITGPDGGFRFDDVSPGSLTLVLGPAEGYVPRGAPVHIQAGAPDVGSLPMLAADPATLVIPEYGGIVPGCAGTSLAMASGSLEAPTSVRLTCVEADRHLPAAPPAGRLPLALLDIAPGSVEPTRASRLTVALPDQPRYAEGVPLELFRLDLNRLTWVPTGVLPVDAGSASATGPLELFGTYLVAAPPFGAFPSDEPDAPAIAQLRVSGRPDGDPADVFATGRHVVYAVFEYAAMRNTTVTVRTTSGAGERLFEISRPYTDRGRDNVPMALPDGPWAMGTYETQILVGEPPRLAHAVSWRVTDEPTPAPVEPTWPPLPTVPDGVTESPAAPSTCRPPAGWYAYRVLPGDTAAALATRTGIGVAELLAANCLRRDRLYAGEILYLPRPPSRRSPVTQPTIAPAWPTKAPGPTLPAARPTESLPAFPTTWYTPPAPPPAKPTPVPATLAPRPTDPPPVPTSPPPLPPTEAAAPAPPLPEPTAKWPTLPPEPPGSPEP